MSVDENQKKAPGDEPVSKGRRNRKKHSGYFHEVFEGILHGGSTLILLVALTAIIHHKEWFADSDEFFARKVAPHVSLEEDEVVKPVIQVIEVNAAARALQMEYVPAQTGIDHSARSKSERSEFERTAGVRPIDRNTMAELLTAIAKVLAARKPDEPLPRVIGIDVDLAPLESDLVQHRKIKEALDQLREIAPVVVIAADRPAGKSREARNEFMHEVNCTLPAQGPKPDGLNPLYFASPSLFAQVGEAPFRFVGEVKDRKTTTPSVLPPVFPSLGTLMFLAVPANRIDVERKWSDRFLDIFRDLFRFHPYAFSESIRSAEKDESLVTICQQAQPNGEIPSSAQIIQDTLAESGGSNPHVESLKEAYRQPMYNWRLLNAAIIQRTVLNPQDFEKLMRGDNGKPFDLQIANVEALVISIAGVGSVDKYFVPYLPSRSEQAPGGAMLHALTMASLEQSVEEISGSGIVIDLVIGIVFLLVAELSLPILKSFRAAAPFAGTLALGTLPLAIAGGLFYWSLKISAWAMQHDIWFNPCLVLIGLVAHAYFEPWAMNAGSDGHQTLIERYSFGLVRLARTIFERREPTKSAVYSAGSLLDQFFKVALCWWILISAIVFVLQGLFSSH